MGFRVNSGRHRMEHLVRLRKHMIIKIEGVERRAQTIFVSFSVVGSTDDQVYTHAFDAAAFVGFSLAQRKAIISGTIRSLLVQPAAPSLGVVPGDTLDIGT